MPHPLEQLPSKIIAVRLNFHSRAKERGRVPEHPSYFLIPPSALAGDGDPLVRPRGCELMGFEGEIALVIGRRAHRVRPETAWSHVRWVTAANDAGVHDLAYADRGSNLRAKGADGFAPLGPRLLDATGLDPAGLRVRTWLNGTPVQDDISGAMHFPFAEIIADLSRLVTLEPGDVILSGSPAGASVVSPGDTVEVEVSAGDLTTGRLRNPVVTADHDLEPWGAAPRPDPAARAAVWGAADTGALPALAGEDVIMSRTPAADLTTEVQDGLLEPAATGAAPAATGAALADAGPAETGTGLLEPARPATPGDPAGVTAAAFATAGTRASLTAVARPLDPRTLAALRSVPVATLSALLAGRGLARTILAGLRTAQPGATMVGTAHTLRCLPAREDLAHRHPGGTDALTLAIEELSPGQVLVIDAQRDTAAATVSVILASRAAQRGAAGIVTDGGVRDSAAVTRLGLPVYYGAATPGSLTDRQIPWETGVPVACGGVLVQPGDILVGDADGVAVIPPGLAGELLAASAEQRELEAFISEQVAAGHPVGGLGPLSAARQEAFARWRRERGGRFSQG